MTVWFLVFVWIVWASHDGIKRKGQFNDFAECAFFGAFSHPCLCLDWLSTNPNDGCRSHPRSVDLKESSAALTAVFSRKRRPSSTKRERERKRGSLGIIATSDLLYLPSSSFSATPFCYQMKGRIFLFLFFFLFSLCLPALCFYYSFGLIAISGPTFHYRWCISSGLGITSTSVDSTLTL